MPDDHVIRTVAVYDSIADAYSVAMNDYTPDEERIKFTKLITPGGMILDLGCAAGRDSIYYSSKGFQTVGVDLSEKLLAIARQKAPQLTFLQQDVRDLRFPDTSFDGIWACAIFLHLIQSEIKLAIKRCYTLLKPNGTLFVMMKNGKGETDVTENLSSGMTRHFTLFQPKELEDVLKESGFNITEIYVWNSKDRYTPRRDVEWISCFARKYGV